MKQPFLPLTSCLTLGLLGLSYGLIAAPAPSTTAPDLLGKVDWGLLSPPGTARLTKTPAGTAQMLHVTVTKPVTPYYQIQLTHDIAAGIPAGTHLRYQFWARSPTHSTFHAVVEKRTVPYTHFIDKQITLTPSWKEYAFTTPALPGDGPRGMAARLQLGQQAGTFEFKNVTVAAASR